MYCNATIGYSNVKVCFKTLEGDYRPTYTAGMPFRTTAVEAAHARGWSKAELRRRTGNRVSLRTIYLWEKGAQPGPKAIEAIMAAFPDLPYERLFVPVDSSALKSGTTEVAPADDAGKELSPA
jgi:hypothetical protein